MKNKKLLIVLVFALALLVRLWRIGAFPVSLSMDEAAIGYNAYSLLKTGKDEFGEFLPLAFKSAGDYKPPVDFYLTVPSIALFGLTEFAVRFPVALIGALTVISLIYLLRELKFSWGASLLGGVWLSILPWHVHFSRASFEAVTALFFLVTGVWLILLWLREKRLYRLILTAISLSLSLWAYHAERLFVPLIALFFIFYYWKEKGLRKPRIKKQLFWCLLTLAVFAIPFLKLTFFTPAIRERASSTSIMRETSLVQSLHQGNYASLTEKVFDNDAYLIFRHWAGKYLNYFDVRFWFWKGMAFTPPGYPDLGLLYAVDLPIFFLGLYFLARSKDKRLKALSLFWFFAGPFPASLTMNEQHPLRALTWLPFFAIAMAGGYEYLLKAVKKNKRKLIWGGYAVLVLASMVYFFDIYTKQFPRHFSEYWQYGYKDAAIYMCANKDEYDTMVLTDTFGSKGPLNTGLPYLYVLFYCDWDREYFLANGTHQPEIQFRRPNKEDFDYPVKSLLVGSPWDFLDGLKEEGSLVKTINYLNGKEALLLIEPGK